MSINDHFESPLLLSISFNKLLERYEALAQNDDEFKAAKAKRVLKIQENYPELRDGFSDVTLLQTYEKEIATILQDSFSPVLTNNEIKTASVPFHDLIFNSSERFKKIVNDAGDRFELRIKNMPDDHRYILACTIILNFCYGYDLNVKRPFFYEIPDSNGIIRYYKILYNADFTEIIPTESAKKITEKDVDDLLDNFDNIELWKEKFPPQSYIFKGFVISNIFDVTDDQSISNIKSHLIGEDKRGDEMFMENFHNIFRSLLNIKDLKVGFSTYNKQEDAFERVYGEGINSFLLNQSNELDCKSVLCETSYNTLLKQKKFYSISDVDKSYEASKGKVPQYKVLKNQGVKSAILAPIATDKEMLGVLELVSNKPKILNSINANKLADVMPYILSAVERSKKDEENLIEAVIQQECTSIHSSVHWRFEKEARHFIRENAKGNSSVTFNKIAFDEVYPLYGQIDIKGSSDARNWATKQDLGLQLKAANGVLKKLFKLEPLPIYEQLSYEIDAHLKGLEKHFQVDSEQLISEFFNEEITPLFTHLSYLNKFTPQIDVYFSTIDGKLGTLYKHRKNYDETIKQINKKMAHLLDKKQVRAQEMYPHYFERYKTDGVEHNMYIGESITKEQSFDPIYLHNLRLWQLQVMCEMENSYYNMRSSFPISLDVASKAFIKGTKKRITEKGKITIVYSQKQDEREYLGYIKFLQAKHYLGTDIEIVELEDLQAVTGLKAIRVSVLYHIDDDKEFYTYDDLMKEIKA